jgi:hypothetical protein
MDTIARTGGERWAFRCDGSSGGWGWTRHAPSGELVSSSRRALRTLDEALADAVESGFSYASRERSA